jgi:putative flippase GtrA
MRSPRNVADYRPTDVGKAVWKSSTNLGVIGFVLFALVGAFGTLAHYTIMITLVTGFEADAVVSSVIGYSIGAAVNYWLNYHVTFRSGARHLRTAPRFLLVAGIGFLLNALIMYILVKRWGAHYLIGQVIATGVVLIANYLANSLWTFRERIHADS